LDRESLKKLKQPMAPMRLHLKINHHQKLPSNNHHTPLHLEKLSRMDASQRTAIACAGCLTAATALPGKTAGG